MTVVPPVPRNGGQILMQQLRIHGARRVFLVPGESYLPCIDALHEHAGAIEPVVCRQESGAAYMAEAYGKLTGEPGICFVTRGPRHQRQHRRAHGLPGFHAHDPVRGPGRQRLHGARGLPGNRLPPHVRPHGQVGRPDRPLRPHPRVHRPRLRHRHQRPARPGGAGAARRHAVGHGRRPGHAALPARAEPSRRAGPRTPAPRWTPRAIPSCCWAAAAGPPGRSSASPPSPRPSSCRSATPGGGWNASTSAIPTPPARSAGA